MSEDTIEFTNQDGKEKSDPEAKRNYDRLVKQKYLYNYDEFALINFLRECYRRSYSQRDPNKKLMMGGGALVFNGANLRLNDMGAYWVKWRNTPGLTRHERVGLISGSSHDSDADQYEIYLEQAGVFLVGLCLNFPGVPFVGAHTWIQSERHAGAGSVIQRLGHLYSYYEHRRHDDMQVGAFGYSPYSEKEGNALLVANLPPYPAD